MAFQSHGSRIKALEWALNPNGTIVAVFLPSDTPQGVAEKKQLLADARAAGLPSVAVRVMFSGASAGGTPRRPED